MDGRAGLARELRACDAPAVWSQVPPNCGAARPEPDVAATEIELHGMTGSRVAVRTPRGELDARAAPPRPLQRLQRARGARRGAASSASRSRGRPRPRRRARGLRAGRDDRGRRQAGLDPADQEPGGANEVLRTLRLEAGATAAIDLWIALNDRIADGRDVSWIWDADFELLADARPPGRLRRHPGAGDGAAAQVRRLAARTRSRSRRTIERSLDHAVAAAPDRLFALPTYTALLELRTLLADRGLAKEYWE